MLGNSGGWTRYPQDCLPIVISILHFISYVHYSEYRTFDIITLTRVSYSILAQLLLKVCCVQGFPQNEHHKQWKLWRSTLNLSLSGWAGDIKDDSWLNLKKGRFLLNLLHFAQPTVSWRTSCKGMLGFFFITSRRVQVISTGKWRVA